MVLGVKAHRISNAFSKTPCIIYLGAWMSGADLLSRRLLICSFSIALVWAGLYIFNEIVDQVREEGKVFKFQSLFLSLPSLIAMIFVCFSFECIKVILLGMIAVQILYTLVLKKYVGTLLLVRVVINPLLRLAIGWRFGSSLTEQWTWIVIAICIIHLSSVSYTLRKSEVKRRKLGYQTIEGQLGRFPSLLTELALKPLLKNAPDLEAERKGWNLFGALSVLIWLGMWLITH